MSKQNTAMPIPPEFSMFGMPIWCHHHCTKCRLKNLDLNRKLLVIEASAASLCVSFDSQASRYRWVVSWRIRHSSDESSQGVRRFSDANLLSAFLKNQRSDNWSDWLIERFGGHSASQEKFIRWQEYLNIPGPGTGHDGDPNISIKVDEAIKSAVQKLLESA